MKKGFLTGLLLGMLTICSIAPTQAAGEQWIRQGDRWTIKDASGNYVTGWIKMNEKWFYMNHQGFMVTGWILPEDGNWYYLNPNSGQMVTGWNRINGKDYYFDKDGVMLTGWIKINRKWYFLNQNTGERLAGWIKIKETWYYLDEESGVMQTGWLSYKGDYYYLLSDGSMVTDKVTINGTQYHFASDGRYLETGSSSSSPSAQPSETSVSPVLYPNAEGVSNASYLTQVVELVNQERKKAGLSPLEIDTNLANAAQVRAKELVDNFSHTRPNGSSCFTAFSEAGVEYISVGENIAAGYSTPEKVVEGWMNSEGHRANILGDYTHIGVGLQVIDSGYQYYWVQCFIHK